MKIKIFIIKYAIKLLKELDNADLKHEILSEAVSHLYRALSPDDILKQDVSGLWIYKGRPLTGAEVSQLKEEAAFIKSMKLWYMIKQDIRYQIGKKVWEECRSKDDILWG